NERLRDFPCHTAKIGLDKRCRGEAGLTLPLAPFFGLTQDLVSKTAGLEGLGGRFVSWPDVGMDFLGTRAPCLADRFEVCVSLQAEHFERTHFIGRAAAV